jgi:hypothetical protein
LLDWGEEGQRTEAEVSSLRAAFIQEVAVWHKLDHPNVTKVDFILFNFNLFSYVSVVFIILYDYMMSCGFNVACADFICLVFSVIWGWIY